MRGAFIPFFDKHRSPARCLSASKEAGLEREPRRVGIPATHQVEQFNNAVEDDNPPEPSAENFSEVKQS
jgi:hypothetical protein